MEGNAKFSDVIEITPRQSNLFVAVSPNPFKDAFTITVQSAARENAVVILSDLGGRQLLKKNEQLLSGLNVVQIKENGNLPTGSYLLTIITSQKTQTIKVAKSN